MADFAVHAEGLGKRYRLGQYDTGYTHLKRLFGRGPERQTMWALDDLHFSIEEGVAVAIVGRNGAGKSTLLKILSRITEPTTGWVDVRGRVGSLLEVGTGFHGELTGRENIFLNGSILGMRRAEIASRFDDIVEFSGVSHYIDTPVKRYSSGMYVRLAFAVAAHMEPDVLIVDEVLAVGDAEFQKRCLGRMTQVAQEGRTVLFVSHNMQAVRRLCDQAILLDRGKLVDQGETEPVVRRYLATIESPDQGRRRFGLDSENQLGKDFCKIREVRITDEDGEARTAFFSSRPIWVTIEFDLERTDPAFVAGFDLATYDGQVVFRSLYNDLADEDLPPVTRGRNALRCVIPPGLLNSGRYSVNLRVALHWAEWIARVDNILQFDVIADHGDSLILNDQARPGVVAPILQWTAVDPESPDEVSAAGARTSA